MLALIDHGVGNLRSVQKALEAVGAQVSLTADPGRILAADRVVLPGVGAFADAMRGLRERQLIDTIYQVVERQTPLLGICVGMQLFFESSEEHGQHAGLGMLAGRVRHFQSAITDHPEAASRPLKIPHTGWNRIRIEKNSPLLQGLPNGSYAYFNHSYFCQAADQADCFGSSFYGLRYTSITGRGRLYGVQFHPEKSQQVGLKILRNFVEHC